MKIICAASSCKYSSVNEDSSNTVFISFPNDETSTIWAHNCGRPDLMIKSNEELHRNYYICSNHIEDRFFLSKSNELVIAEGAIPTRFSMDCESPIDFHQSHKEQYSPDNVVESLQLTNCINNLNNSCPPSYSDPSSSEYQNTLYNAKLHEENCINTDNNTSADSQSNFCNININMDQLDNMTVRFSDLCRICGQSTTNGINISKDDDDDDDDELKIKDKIHMHLPILFESLDPLPQLICSDCYEKLEASHSLVITSLQTDIRLRKYLNIPSKYNHAEKFADLISMQELQINNELNTNIVSPVEELSIIEDKSKARGSTSEFNVTIEKNSPHQVVDAQPAIQCLNNNLLCARLDSRLKFAFHPELNNLILEPLQPLADTSIENNSSLVDSDLVSEENPELTCLNRNEFQQPSDDAAITAEGGLKQETCHENLYKDNQTKFNCDKCDSMFDKVEELDSHREIHGKKDVSSHRRRCGHCSLPFANRKELQTHITEAHTSHQMLFKCGTCDKIYEKWSSLDVHEATHRHDKPYLCDLCGKSFKHSNNLRGHKRIHLDIAKKKRHVCEICGNAFRSRFHLGEHMNQHDGNKPYICEQCGKAFSKRIQLRQHRLSHGVNKYACPICGVTFNRRGNMNSHLKRHSSSDGTYTCSVCEHKCQSMSELKMHRKQHTENDILESIRKKCRDNTLWQCKICTRVFAKRSALVSHERKHDANQVRIECKQCGKKLANSNSLKYHTKSVHTSERPHECQHCKNTFISKEAKLIHERIHTGERPYACKLCNMQYRCSSNLSQHMKVHCDVRPYLCQYCHKSFTRKGALTVHERIHTGVRPFACAICDKRFSQKNDMIKHTKTHQPNKSLRCEDCNEIFATKTEMFEHLETVHKSNSATIIETSDDVVSSNSDIYSIDVSCSR